MFMKGQQFYKLLYRKACQIFQMVKLRVVPLFFVFSASPLLPTAEEDKQTPFHKGRVHR